MKYETNLLIISEDLASYDLLKSSTIKNICDIYVCRAQEDVLFLIKDNNIRVVIMELTGEEEDIKFLKLMKTCDPLLYVIIVGEPLSSETVIDWTNLGAIDYLTKPLQVNSVKLILKKIEEKRTLRKETYLLEKEADKKYIFQGIVGKNPYMLDVFSIIENIAKYFTNILITGETGTGKEMVAQAIHNLTPVKNRNFVVCNCASIPDSLFESELFGYVKGAFTGANKDKKGMFEEAHEGIIFLDEIAEIPVTVQAKLLRVLENYQFRPLGSDKDKKVDVKVIATSSRDLGEGIKNKNFREDLYHRLNKVEIYLPPLRDRSEDIPLLVRYFLDQYNKKLGKEIKGVSRKVQKLFLSYNWSGNVRELKNVMESAFIFCKKEFIDIIDLPKYLRDHLVSSVIIPFVNRENLTTLDNLEKEYIIYLLGITKNNKRKTAKILDVSRTTLYNKLNKYNILNLSPN